ncbi:MAG: hypothetical protein WCA11_00555 [Terracidiphilus sp.]
MEIGPVTGVRAVSLLSVRKADAAQLPVFEIDPSARAGDETYSSSNQQSGRGLEDEDSTTLEDDDSEPFAPTIQAKPGGGFSCFA